MRASEAKDKLCPFSFARSYAENGGPALCQTDSCMAWSVFRAAGTTLSYGRNAPLPNGYEEVEEGEPRPGTVAPRMIRATEDHGECHALPARPE